MKKGDVGWLNTSIKSTETRDELSITLYQQSEINFCSVRMPVNARCYIPTSLPQKQAAKTNTFSGKDPEKEYLILCTFRRGVAITCI